MAARGQFVSDNQTATLRISLAFRPVPGERFIEQIQQVGIYTPFQDYAEFPVFIERRAGEVLGADISLGVGCSDVGQYHLGMYVHCQATAIRD